MVIKRVTRYLQYKSRKYLDIPSEFYKYYKSQKLTSIQNWFLESLCFFKASTSKKAADGIVLVQMVKDYENTLKIAAASKVIAEQQNLTVCFYDVYIDKINYANVPWNISFVTKICNAIHEGSLIRMYRAFADEMIFTNSAVYSNQGLIACKKEKILTQIKKNGIASILDIEVEGILIGDLIYDTYLRFDQMPTIESVDSFLLVVIESALNIFYSFYALVTTRKIKCLINTYSSYLHHGIPARICVKEGIDVYAIGSISYVMQKLTIDFPYHAPNQTLFDPQKNIGNEAMETARQNLVARFSGTVEAATSYMQKSAFLANPISPDLKKQFASRPRNIVIYPHDFYDSPHINRLLQFSDLYEYLRQTLEAVAQLQDSNVYIKIHPNSTSATRTKTKELVDSFARDHFFILDDFVSNLNIIELKPDLVCTARGTVGMEMAYFGIPVVALFDNMYVNFKFVQTCMNKEKYFSILRGEEKVDIDFSKESIYSYYYQAHLEKLAGDNEGLILLLASLNGKTYDDEYLAFIKKNKEKIFSPEFIDLFRQSYLETT